MSPGLCRDATIQEGNVTTRKKDDPDSRLALVLMRFFRGWWEKTLLAAAARFSPGQVGMWERGERNVPRRALERVADATGVPRYLLDLMLRALRSFRLAARGRSRAGRALGEVFTVELLPLAGEAVDVILDPLEPDSPEHSGEDETEALWARLEPSPEAERWRLVNENRELRSWRLCVRVCEESRKMAANHPREALELVRLAVRIAELVPGRKEWRWRLQGIATGYLSNALRATDDLPAAEQALGRASKLWEDGAPGDPGLLNPAVLPSIEANLRCDQRNFPLALKRIKEALELDTGELRAKILLTRSNIHDALGETEESTAALLEAASLIDAEREPRLAFGLEFNLVDDLCDLGRAREAQARLAGVRRLAERLGEELDLVRVSWLEGKAAAGLGLWERARGLFEKVRSAFEREELSYDYALVSLDLAQVHLEQGHTAEVRAIADEMFRIFQSQQVPREALAALQVFCEAARQETATLELTRNVLRFLHRAQHDPELRF
jgi:tetratricopeptide (TPR) repeat protein